LVCIGPKADSAKTSLGKGMKRSPLKLARLCVATRAEATVGLRSIEQYGDAYSKVQPKPAMPGFQWNSEAY